MNLEAQEIIRIATGATVLPPLPDETPVETLRRAVSWLDYNNEDMLSELPSVEACLDFFNLISNEYDVSTFEEVMECIEEGCAEPDPLAEFVVRWGLWDKWTFNIDSPQHSAVRDAILRIKEGL